MVQKWELQGSKMMCPRCGKTDDLSRNEVVQVNTYIDVNEDGTWDWSEKRLSAVHWETSDYHEKQGEPEWRCGHCNIDFNAPDLPVPYKIVELSHG